MELLEQIKQAGIVGCGGAGFPTHVKLNCKVEYLIINGAECEPLLRTDRWLMIYKASEIIAAVETVAAHVEASQIYIALKETYKEEISRLTQAIEEKNSRIKLFPMKNYYPAGDEQSMVCDITGKTVPPAGIPLDVGAVVSNIATMYSVYEATIGRSFTHKYLTVTGAVANPVVVHVPIGTSIEACIEMAGGPMVDSYKIILGGPLMGKIISRDELSEQTVMKTTSGIIIIPDDNVLARGKEIPVSAILKQARTACVQCSYCTQMCPRYLSGHPLQPHKIMRNLSYAANPESMLEKEDVKQALICSECGVCEAFACPMGLKPRQVNSYIKGLLSQRGIRYQKPSESFVSRDEREYRRIPSKRLAARLGVASYYDTQIHQLVESEPLQVSISLKQHIGSPAVPVVMAGDQVTVGQLIAKCPEQSLGANIHASITGTVTSVDRNIIIGRS